jgi:serine/threonine-protein kinase RsbW
MNRLDDAMILCDALSAHAPAHANDGRVAFTVLTGTEGIELRVGELAEQGATKLLAAVAIPGVGNVLERLSDELRIEPSSAEHSREELILRLRFV